MQENHKDKTPKDVEQLNSLLQSFKEPTWIPDDAVGNKLDLPPISHADSHGHRGFDFTWYALHNIFT